MSDAVAFKKEKKLPNSNVTGLLGYMKLIEM